MKKAVIIGGGPAGLMATEQLAAAGVRVDLYDHKPTLGRKFLMAGRGGLNLTHSEDMTDFLARYGTAAPLLAPAIKNFTPADLRAWCEGLEQKTFIGSSGRVFPESLKASPLLRAWLARLETMGVVFHPQRRWTGWNVQGRLRFVGPDDTPETAAPDVTLLALGGGSWAKLGSDGEWMEILRDAAIPVTQLRPANCGFIAPWSDYFRTRFAGQPLKTVTVSFQGKTIPGEVMITATGIEGGAIYAQSAALREACEHGPATFTIDLKSGLGAEAVAKKLAAPRGSQSLSTYLQKTLNLPPVSIALLRESGGDLTNLPALIKAVPLTVTGPCPIDRAISTTGGVAWDALDSDFMLKEKPGLFVAGEMIDWEAPTGGYLLQACFSTAVAAAQGMLQYLDQCSDDKHR